MTGQNPHVFPKAAANATKLGTYSPRRPGTCIQAKTCAAKLSHCEVTVISMKPLSVSSCLCVFVVNQRASRYFAICVLAAGALATVAGEPRCGAGIEYAIVFCSLPWLLARRDA